MLGECVDDLFSDFPLFVIKHLNFHLYIYPSDSLESHGGANKKGKQLPRPASGDAKILLSG